MMVPGIDMLRLFIIRILNKMIIKNNSINQYVTKRNEKYIILSVRGLTNYIKDFDSCLEKRDEIVSDLSIAF